ncbi:sigma-E processing peptidase SpoIIGA [Neobacillus kokaensis]|uniref:Sporulation sigma-E factor-processing peptidase n=1 Tax=Neobacillus kokaensis TaxID=2759023 RepID=A0ABQ3N5M1_9BACI|nr:sigma-E processing peptidase SpoIIGA [Neobacillus kokaensis]GHH96476.1 sporulation sigma-E factor-processing peptidase [Neobacillus kokaensis]
MIVYLDVIWMLNFLFDSLLLYLTAIFLKRKIRFWRLAAGGFTGSLIILLSFTPLNVYSNHPIAKLFCSFMMVLVTFGYKRLSFFMKALFTLYVSTFLIGGALIGAHYFSQYDAKLSEQLLLSSVKGLGDPISWMFVLIGFPIAWHFSRKNIESMEMTKIQYEQIVKVQVEIEDETFTFKGLIDSGNQLYDPLSRLPVMFVSVRNKLEIFPLPIRKIAVEPESILMGSDELPGEWQGRLRIVPYSVVGQEHSLIAALRPDNILIEHNGDRYICPKGLISFTMQQLSKDDAFECIVHPKMMTGPKSQGENEKVS